MRKTGDSRRVAGGIYAVCGLFAVSVLVTWQICRAQEGPAVEVKQPGPSTNPAERFKAIRKLAESGQHMEAARELRELSRAHAAWKRIDEVNLLLGSELVLSGEVSAGKDILDRIIQKAPDSPLTAACCFYSGMAMEALGDFPGAILSYDVLLRRFPNHELAAKAALREALLSEKVLENRKRALEIYEQFVQKYPNHPSTAAVRNHLGLLAEAGVVPGKPADPAAAAQFYREYATRHPDDVGDPAMNGGMAGAAAALWRAAELTSKLKEFQTAVDIYKQYETLPRAKKGEGFITAARLLVPRPDVGDPQRLFEAALKAKPQEAWRLEYARWLRGKKKDNEAAKQFLLLVETSKYYYIFRKVVAESLNALGPERVRTYVDRHPTDFAVFKHYLGWFKGGDKRVEGRQILDKWLTRGDIGWKTTIAQQWVQWTGELEDCSRLIKAADGEGAMGASISAAFTAAKKLTAAKSAGEAQAVLVKALSTWSVYPDFPRVEFTKRLAAVARLEPLMMPNPKKVPAEPQKPKAPPAGGQKPVATKPVEPDKVISPKGVAARKTAIDLIKKHKLNADPVGADLLAQLHCEIDAKAAVTDVLAAARALIQAKRLNEAAIHVAALLKELPEHDVRIVDLLHEAGLHGAKGWGKFWKGNLVPKAQAELKHFEAVNPQTEQSRFARVRLLRLLDAKKSVAAHQEFLKSHPNSAHATAIGRSLLNEMKRAGMDPKPVVLQAIKDTEKNPAVALGILPELIPGGPDGYDLYVTNVRKALAKASATLAPQLLLGLAAVHEQFKQVPAAMQTLREIVGKYGNSTQAIEARRAAVKLFDRSSFAPGTTQEDAEQAFAWLMDLRLRDEDITFSRLSGNVWRLACNPTYRLHGPEKIDVLYLHATQKHFQAHKRKTKTMAECYPLIMSEAAVNHGAWGLTQWDAYLRKFPRDVRGRMMRLETLILMNPSRAVRELNALIKKYPGNVHYRERLADCLWRMGRRDEALKHYETLAGTRTAGPWECSYNRVYRQYFLKEQTPVDFAEQYQDRIRAHGVWATWLARAVKKAGDNGAIAARLEAAAQVDTLAHKIRIRRESLGRINAAIVKENGNLESAKALAAKEDADERVRIQALEAIARSDRRLKELQKELAPAQARLKAAEGALARLRAAVGLKEDQPSHDVFVNFALGCLKKGTIDAPNSFVISHRLWSGGNKEAARPFIEHVLRFSTHSGQIAWAVDRLVEFAVGGKDVGTAADILSAIGWRRPKDGQHANWLKRSCDLALQSANVYLFARNAHLLAKLHPANKGLSSYLDRLGEVFEKAGNFTSAENEYNRVIQTVKDSGRKRVAQLSLVRLYQRQARSVDALRVLSDLIKLTLPEQERLRDKSIKRKPRAQITDDGRQNGKESEPAAEDIEALLLAVRCYLSLELNRLALDTYDRAERQKKFGSPVKPERELLMDLAGACLDTRMYALAGRGKEEKEELKFRALPVVTLKRAQKALKLTDTLFRFYGPKMSPRARMDAALLRADANIMMRNYPRAIEEIRAAKKAAGDSPAQYLADIKMGEIHLATDNADQALPIFRKLADMSREDISPVALFWLGSTKLMMNKRDEAIESFRTLWERYAESELVRRAVYAIARTYAEQGAFLDAIRLYEAVGAINSVRREKVVPGDVLTVRVWDADHYLGTGQYTIPVKLCTSAGDVEDLLLDMNKINRSLFLGTIRTKLGEPKHGDGILQVYGTDLIYVTYEDKFKGVEDSAEITDETVRGERRTSLIQVVENGRIKVSPVMFVEEKEEEEDAFREKTKEEIQEEQRLAALSAQLDRGEGVIRPGNVVYIRVKDGDLDCSSEADTARVTVLTYSLAREQPEEEVQVDLKRELEKPLEFAISERIPSHSRLKGERDTASLPEDLQRLDSVELDLIETGPHTGVFCGTVKTGVNEPTAVVSDHSAESIAALAIDGNNGAKDAWVGFIDGKPGKWIEVDLKELYDVAKIVWDRGQGEDDRYMIDYTVTLSGSGAAVNIERKDNKSAHNNEIVLEKPVVCRWIRFTAHKYEGDAPAISQIQVFDKDGRQIVPSEVSPLDRARNDVLEFNVGDFMAAEFVDDENVKPGRSVKRVSNPLGVGYGDGYIDAVYLSYTEVWGVGRIRIGGEKVAYVRRTKRVSTDGVLQIVVVDPDMDIDKAINTVECEALSSSGDSAKLTAKEIDKTVGVFLARIQLSPNPEAKDDALRLWVRPGDYVMLRYADKENRNPGHAVFRQSFVFTAEDEVGDFPPDIVMAKSPHKEELIIEPPHWTFVLRDPDKALPGIDRTEMQALSFTTGDRIKFDVLLQDLDGLFSSRVPVVMGDKPYIELPKDVDPDRPRRIRLLEQDRMRRQTFEPPFAVVGDDIVWISYEDSTPRCSKGRVFLGVVSPAVIEKLHMLEVNTDDLPEAAKTEGLQITLRDPFAVLQSTDQTRQQGILSEIARKKRHYKRLLVKYQAALEGIGKKIEEFSRKETARQSKLVEGKEEERQAIGSKDAPLTLEEELEQEGFEGLDVLAIEDVIRATALRRDRDGLAQAMKELQRRLNALNRYKTAEVEAAIDKAEEEYRAKMKEAADTAEEAEPKRATEEPEAWYGRTDWWKHCGGVVPGTVLKIRVEDPDIQGDSAVVMVAPLGSCEPHFIEFTGAAVEGEQGVFEVAVPTVPDAAAEGALPLNGVDHVMVSYRDTFQQNFPTKRSSYLSLASDAEVRITGSDFLNSKTNYHLGEDVYLLIRDDDMDKTRARDYLWVEITSDKGDKESIPVRESQPHSGVFRGCVPTQFGAAEENDGVLQCEFGGQFAVGYVDELWRNESVLPPEHVVEASFVKGSDGQVEIFARQLRRGALQRDVLFNTALAEYELGNSSTKMGVVQKGRRHLLRSGDKFQLLIEQYPDDPVCAHATYYQGNIHFLLGDYAAAAMSLQRIIDRWPKTEFKTMALFKLGACHLKAGRFDKAVESFISLAYHHKDSPFVAEAMLTLAHHFSKQKLHDSAIGVGEAFIRKFPDHEKTWNVYLRLAGWLMMEKRFKCAHELFEEAEKLMPDSPLIPVFLYWHADCLFKMTMSIDHVDYKKGIILLQRVTYDYPESKWARYASARLAELGVDE